MREATHTDEQGNIYRVIGDTPKEFCVDYWDTGMQCWNQDLGTDFTHLIKIAN